MTDDIVARLLATIDNTCGDCIEGRCHWGGEHSRQSIAAAEAGRDYVHPSYGRCGCALHEASVRVRDAELGSS